MASVDQALSQGKKVESQTDIEPSKFQVSAAC